MYLYETAWKFFRFEYPRPHGGCACHYHDRGHSDPVFADAWTHRNNTVEEDKHDYRNQNEEFHS